MTTDWPDDNPSAHRALAIFNQTVPLGVANNQLDTRTVTVTVGTSQSFGPFTVGQIGHELALSYDATNGSANTLNTKLTWSDPGTGIVTDIDQFGVRSGPAANPHVLRMYGRSKGGRCLLTFDNSASGFDAHLTYVWLQQSRVYQRETFKTLSWGANVGDILPGFNMPGNTLAFSNPNINAGLQATRNLPAWAGNVWLQAETSSGAADFEVEILDQSTIGGIVFDETTNAKGHLQTQLCLPRNQCELIMTNHNAAAQLCEVMLVIAPPE